MKKLLILTFLLMFSTAIFAKNLQVVVISTNPQFTTEQTIKQNLKSLDGIKTVEANSKKQSIRIIFDQDKISLEEIEKSLKKIGFDTIVKEKPKKYVPVDATSGATCN